MIMIVLLCLLSIMFISLINKIFFYVNFVIPINSVSCCEWSKFSISTCFMLAAKGLKDHLLDGFGTSYDTMGIFNVSIKRPPFKWLVNFDSSELYVIAIVRTFYQLIASAFQIWCNVYFQTLVM